MVRYGVMNWRLVTVLAVVIAAAAGAGLGVDVVVAGTARASGLAGVIVGFCELVALVLGVASWAAHRREARERHASGLPEASEVPVPVAPESAADARPGNASPKYVVDARGAHGVQVGDHGIQHNEFGPGAGSSDER
jgi:hypothetical protein